MKGKNAANMIAVKPIENYEIGQHCLQTIFMFFQK
jgi:hypothetical protein